MSRVGLTLDQIDDPEQRIDAGDQIAFLEIAAEVLNDEFLGFSLAEEFDCRDLGLLYYVMASCDTLGGALKRASRYTASPMKPSYFSIGSCPNLRSV